MKPGSIVVCIDATFTPEANSAFSSLPVKNGLYTVREVIPHPKQKNGPPGLALEEIIGRREKLYNYEGRLVEVEVTFKIIRFKEVLPPMAIEEFMARLCPDEELVEA